MDYTTESQIKQVEYSEKSAVQECLLLPSALFGFHNTATTVEQTKSGRDVFVLYPFWQMTRDNRQATYACLNYGEAYCPREIEKQAICLDGDVASVFF